MTHHHSSYTPYTPYTHCIQQGTQVHHVIGLDGNHDHVDKDHTLISMGWYDHGHHFHPLSFGVMTSKEAAYETKLMIEVVSDYMNLIVGKPLPRDSRWMMDGAQGFRNGVRDWRKAQDKGKDEDDEGKGEQKGGDQLDGMCYFHVGHNCAQQHARLPSGSIDKGQMLYDVDRLA